MSTYEINENGTTWVVQSVKFEAWSGVDSIDLGTAKVRDIASFAEYDKAGDLAARMASGAYDYEEPCANQNFGHAVFYRAFEKHVELVEEPGCADSVECGEYIAVYDAPEDRLFACPVKRHERREGYGSLYVVEGPGYASDNLAVIVGELGDQMTPSDWQGEQPGSLDEAGEFNWVDARLMPTLMLDGLPHIAF